MKENINRLTFQFLKGKIRLPDAQAGAGDCGRLEQPFNSSKVRYALIWARDVWETALHSFQFLKGKIRRLEMGRLALGKAFQFLKGKIRRVCDRKGGSGRNPGDFQFLKGKIRLSADAWENIVEALEDTFNSSKVRYAR